jgi:hypothetical protein
MFSLFKADRNQRNFRPLCRRRAASSRIARTGRHGGANARSQHAASVPARRGWRSSELGRGTAASRTGQRGACARNRCPRPLGSRCTSSGGTASCGASLADRPTTAAGAAAPHRQQSPARPMIRAQSLHCQPGHSHVWPFHRPPEAVKSGRSCVVSLPHSRSLDRPVACDDARLFGLEFAPRKRWGGGVRPWATDPALAERLWGLSEKVTGLGIG